VEVAVPGLLLGKQGAVALFESSEVVIAPIRDGRGEVGPVLPLEGE
jgi:hypothetical protein